MSHPWWRRIVRKQDPKTAHKQPLTSRPAWRFVPGVEVLEDRISPALLSGVPSPFGDTSTIRLVNEPRPLGTRTPTR